MATIDIYGNIDMVDAAVWYGSVEAAPEAKWCHCWGNRRSTTAFGYSPLLSRWG